MIIQCGFPRAGSTLLYLMMRHSVTNFKFFEKETKALSTKGGDIVTKRPMDIFDYKKIINKWPDTKFIINIRDPRSVLTSIHANSEGQYKVNWDYSVKTGIGKDGVGKVMPGKTKGLMDYMNVIYDVPQAIFVYYEDLIKAPDIEHQRIGEFCNFKYHDTFSNFHKQKIPNLLRHQLNGVRPLDMAPIEKWRNHPERIKQQFKAFPDLFDALIQLGYEKDREWIKKL